MPTRGGSLGIQFAHGARRATRTLTDRRSRTRRDARGCATTLRARRAVTGQARGDRGVRCCRAHRPYSISVFRTRTNSVSQHPTSGGRRWGRCAAHRVGSAAYGRSDPHPEPNRVVSCVVCIPNSNTQHTHNTRRISRGALCTLTRQVTDGPGGGSRSAEAERSPRARARAQSAISRRGIPSRERGPRSVQDCQTTLCPARPVGAITSPPARRASSSLARCSRRRRSSSTGTPCSASR